MNKVNTEKYTESFEQWFRDVEAGDDPNWSSPPYLSQEWYQYLSRRELALGAWNKALEIALPTLAQQEQAEGEWIEWAGGLQPVCDGTLLDIKFRDNEVGANNLAENWIWDHAGDSDDIIAYRIILASRNGV